MERKGHYVKPGTRCRAPSVLFSVCMNPRILEHDEGRDRQVRGWGDCHVWLSRRHGAKWAHPREFATNNPDELFAWMHSHARRNSRNYVVAPLASDALTLSGFWEEAEATGATWEPVKSRPRTAPEDGVTRFRRLVLRGVPDIVDFSRYGFRWLWLSGRQYLPLDEEDIASSLRVPWIDTAKRESPDGVTRRTARERAHLWVRALMQLSDWWQANATASWGFTAGQLAMGVLRTHVAPKALCTHSDPRVHRLERDAAYGGRCSTWYLGDVGPVAGSGSAARESPSASKFGSIPGPLQMIDVRSMYPTILRDQTFPRKLWSYRENPPRGEPQDAARSYGVIADVTIETEQPEYPRRNGQRVEYPVGRFDTTLTGPELLALRKDGKVIACHRMALYDVGPVFKDAAGAMIDMRERARKGGNLAWEFFAKLLGNSMGGKLAQSRGRWLERRKVPPKAEWGEWFEGKDKDGRPRRFRSVCGLVWEWVTDQAGGGAHTAAFDYLTAYGRLWMRRVRASAPPRSIISQDTDGLWCLPEAVDAIRRAGHAFGDRAGELRVDKYSDYGRFFGPRHYYTMQGWTLAGFSSATVLQGAKAVDHTHEMNPVRSGVTHAPHVLYTVSKRAQLKLEAPAGRITPDGWVEPVELH